MAVQHRHPTTGSHSTHGPPRLPLEIIEQIICQDIYNESSPPALALPSRLSDWHREPLTSPASRADLRTFSLVSRGCRRIAQRLLWKRVSLPPETWAYEAWCASAVNSPTQGERRLQTEVLVLEEPYPEEAPREPVELANELLGCVRGVRWLSLSRNGIDFARLATSEWADLELLNIAENDWATEPGPPSPTPFPFALTYLSIQEWVRVRVEVFVQLIAASTATLRTLILDEEFLDGPLRTDPSYVNPPHWRLLLTDAGVDRLHLDTFHLTFGETETPTISHDVIMLLASRMRHTVRRISLSGDLELPLGPLLLLLESLPQAESIHVSNNILVSVTALLQAEGLATLQPEPTRAFLRALLGGEAAVGTLGVGFRRIFDGDRDLHPWTEFLPPNEPAIWRTFLSRGGKFVEPDLS